MPDKTPQMMDVPTFTQEMAIEQGKAKEIGLSQQFAMPEGTKWYIIQHGPEAHREGEPAEVVGYTNFAGKKAGFYAAIRFGDGHTAYVDMGLPQYGMGKAPPAWYAPWDHYNAETGKTERRADRKRWLEFVPEPCIRKSYKVKG